MRGEVAAAIAAALVVSTGRADAEPWPMPEWPTAEPTDLGMNEALLEEAREYAQTGGGSGFIVFQGYLVMSWGSSTDRYDLKSTTKSIGVTALGLAILDGRLALDDLATDHHPSLGVPPDSNADTGWLPLIGILHLATQTAGFDKDGGYTPLLFDPGTEWSYSDGGPNWLAECVTLTYGRDLEELLFERVFAPLGIEDDDLRWRDNSYRDHEIDGISSREFGSGIRANVDAMARIGYLYLNRGEWDGERVIPASFVDRAGVPEPSIVGLPVNLPESYFDASSHYGLLWWNNGDGTMDSVPTDAFWSWGLYDSFIIVVPSLDLVVARAGSGWRSGFSADYDVLEPFLGPIVGSIDPSTIEPDSGPDAGPDSGPDAGPGDGGSVDGGVADGSEPDGGGVEHDADAAGDASMADGGLGVDGGDGADHGSCECRAATAAGPAASFPWPVLVAGVVAARLARRRLR